MRLLTNYGSVIQPIAMNDVSVGGAMTWKRVVSLSAVTVAQGCSHTLARLGIIRLWHDLALAAVLRTM